MVRFRRAGRGRKIPYVCLALAEDTADASRLDDGFRDCQGRLGYPRGTVPILRGGASGEGSGILGRTLHAQPSYRQAQQQIFALLYGFDPSAKRSRAAREFRVN
ncbi:hypothetical protein [Paenibacillus pabuli]|uniref:hypothetical protein n=1 Tax=Paenibacillus pabuli TaxID=1472 RepID=UPI001FDF1F32|nr:hypothetical protein [Paenibacillus pabuli]MEC0128251.1 hypothetical protein [Paenibacillus pabuli]